MCIDGGEGMVDKTRCCINGNFVTVLGRELEKVISKSMKDRIKQYKIGDVEKWGH